MRLGVLGYADRSGLGRMTADLIEQLGAVKHLAPSNGGKTKAWPRDLAPWTLRLDHWRPTRDELGEFLDGLDVVVSAETDYGCDLAHWAWKHSVRSVLIPMGEWWDPVRLSGFDAYILTSSFTAAALESRPPLLDDDQKVARLPWPVDTARFSFRERATPARVFLHCAGHLGMNYRKGTPEAVAGFAEAWRRGLPDGCKLIVRSQKPIEALPVETSRAIASCPAIDFRHEDLERVEDLYAEGDAYLYTARLDGQSLVPLESMACGLPTFVTDAAPMNDHACNEASTGAFNAMRIPANGTERVRLVELDVPLWKCSIDSLAYAIQYAAMTPRCVLATVARDQREWVEREASWGALRPRWLEVLGG